MEKNIVEKFGQDMNPLILCIITHANRFILYKHFACKKAKCFFILLCISLNLSAQIDTNTLNTNIQHKKKKWDFIFSTGLFYSNHIVFPEKIINGVGLVQYRKTTKYGYELGFNTGLTFYKGLGVNIDYIFGMMPDGINFTNTKPFKEDTIWQNGFVSDPTMAPLRNGFGSPYFGFNFQLFYLLPICKHLSIRPYIGVKSAWYHPYRTTGEYEFCSTTVDSCIKFVYSIASNYNLSRHFQPELNIGVHFFVYGKNPQHCLDIGLIYNHCFQTRLEGKYEVFNLGATYNSSGEIRYKNSFFGISIGYQFFTKGIKKLAISNKKYLFNPNKSLGTKFETDMEKEGHHICQTVHPTTFCF